MLLALDVGNTDTVFGVFKEDRLVFHGRGSTSKLRGLFKKYKKQFQRCDAVIVASVVPAINSKIRLWCKSSLKIKKIVFVSHKTPLPIKLRIDNPQEMGADRIANNSAAYLKYKRALLVIDFGTATTIDYVDKMGSYRGGVIVPGLYTSFHALTSKAARLKDVPIKRPRRVLGKNTQSQLQSGGLIAHAAMIDKMIEKIQKEIRKRPKVVVTGGLSSALKPISSTPMTLEPHLTLRGLQWIMSSQGDAKGHTV